MTKATRLDKSIENLREEYSENAAPGVISRCINELLAAFDEHQAALQTAPGETCAHDHYRNMDGDWQCLKCRKVLE